ncbi:hypothetical protein CIB95_15580 [Lottiidibacillus patelloidae]|uniref:Uncharacterized protein n=1 Tax=Lottiidibacillus patelloidae TaxID=2670334 RepID=A0A263BQD0_9BACI|nr:hypothetical protein [Lottiidibacillus patelloidae]OZM55782.1 hypothetical protein CIB95_15580 [Lottiidibacillus patelloidae]
MFQHNELRKAFLYHASFSLLAGLFMLFLNSLLMETMGIVRGYILPLFGIMLILFAVFLILVSRIRKMDKWLAWAIVCLNVFLIFSSGYVIFEIDLTFIGNSLVFIVAIVVLALTTLQIKGIQRSKALKVRM